MVLKSVNCCRFWWWHHWRQGVEWPDSALPLWPARLGGLIGIGQSLLSSQSCVIIKALRCRVRFSYTPGLATLASGRSPLSSDALIDCRGFWVMFYCVRKPGFSCSWSEATMFISLSAFGLCRTLWCVTLSSSLAPRSCPSSLPLPHSTLSHVPFTHDPL